MSEDLSTEEKIREAARRVFVAKGFDGCSVREIAREAGMNVALVNYYFRSKGQLFKLIFHAAMEDFLLSMMDVFQTDFSLEMKMRIFIEREYEFLTNHPELPGFIVSELSRGDASAFEQLKIHERIRETGVFEQVALAQERGEMRRIDLVSITLLLLSNCQFPFLGSPIIKGVHKLSEEHYEQQLRLHKQYVTEMLIQYLFPHR